MGCQTRFLNQMCRLLEGLVLADIGPHNTECFSAVRMPQVLSALTTVLSRAMCISR
jgi:hypothetical protein